MASGVHLKVMQERPGHSSITVTADLYSHVTPGLQRDAANQIAVRALGSWRPALTNGLQEGPGDDSTEGTERASSQVSGGGGVRPKGYEPLTF